MDDRELLERYVKDGCAKSFGIIMRRHIGWVYSASLRQVGDAALAEDVTQSVFVLLTRRAGELGEKVVLRGWLFNTLRFVAREARRNQGRRRRHEAQVAVESSAAAKMNRIEESAWEQMSPLLDEAVAALRESDRQAVLLRFYEGKSFAQVGDALGVSEVAARKRVSRAVSRLGVFYKRRGVIVPAAMAVTLMLARTASAAPPPGLVEALAGACGGSAMGPVAMTLVRAAAGRMVKARRRLAAAIVACMGLLGVGLWMLLMAWLVGQPAAEPIPQMESVTSAAAGAWVGRAGDGVLDETFELPQRRPIKGSARFEITPVERVEQDGSLKQFDVMWWVTRWIEGNRAEAARRVKPALKGRGRVGEIDPVTGKPWPPSDADPEDVNSFADMGRTGGGGGGGAAAKSAAAGTAVNVADGEAKSGGGGGDRGGDWRAAVLDVVVSASSSATSAAATVDAPQLNVGVTLGRAGPLAFYHAADHGDSGQVSFIYVGGQIWGVQRFVIVSAGDRVSRIVTVGEDGKVAPVEGDVAVVGTVIDASALLAQLSDWLDSGNQAAETALRKEFPTGINWDDPKELVALQSLLTQITAPSSSPPISVGHLNATAVPEPAGICLALVGLAMGLGRRRRR